MESTSISPYLIGYALALAACALCVAGLVRQTITNRPLRAIVLAAGGSVVCLVVVIALDPSGTFGAALSLPPQELAMFALARIQEAWGRAAALQLSPLVLGMPPALALPYVLKLTSTALWRLEELRRGNHDVTNPRAVKVATGLQIAGYMFALLALGAYVFFFARACSEQWAESFGLDDSVLSVFTRVASPLAMVATLWLLATGRDEHAGPGRGMRHIAWICMWIGACVWGDWYVLLALVPAAAACGLYRLVGSWTVEETPEWWDSFTFDIFENALPDIPDEDIDLVHDLLNEEMLELSDGGCVSLEYGEIALIGLRGIRMTGQRVSEGDRLLAASMLSDGRIAVFTRKGLLFYFGGYRDRDLSARCEFGPERAYRAAALGEKRLLAAFDGGLLLYDLTAMDGRVIRDKTQFEGITALPAGDSFLLKDDRGKLWLKRDGQNALTAIEV